MYLDHKLNQEHLKRIRVRELCGLFAVCITRLVNKQERINPALTYRNFNLIPKVPKESEEGKETYIGLTGNTFKTRFRNHAASFRDINKRNAMELSKYIWSLNYTYCYYNFNP